MSNDLQKYLARAAYEGVVFPVLKADMQRGNDSVLHKARRVNGADIERVGAREAKGRFDVVLSNSIPGFENSFPGLYAQLSKLFDERPLGLLTHPTRGLIEVHIDSWDESLSPHTTDGVASFSFSWTENGRAEGDLFDASDSAPSLGSVSEQMATQATAADNAVATAIPNALQRPTLVAPVITQQTAFLESSSRTYREAIASIREMTSVVTDAIESTQLVGSTGYTARGLLLDLRALVVQYQEAYYASRKVRTFVVPATQTLAQIAANPAVFGDAKRAGELLAANNLTDVFSVREGTVLTVVGSV